VAKTGVAWRRAAIHTRLFSCSPVRSFCCGVGSVSVTFASFSGVTAPPVDRPLHA